MEFQPHHVALTVSNIEKTIEFYKKFGFKEVIRWKAEDNSLIVVHLKLNNFILELFSFKDVKEGAVEKELFEDLKHKGYRHFALKVENLEEIYSKLKEKGIIPINQITEGKTGIKYFFIKDPEGNFLEIVEDKRKF